MSPEKVDSSSLEAKVELRRWLLKRMKIDEAYVLDTCAGLGHIWDAMQEHVNVRQWTRCDIKPRRPGTIKLDATEAIERFPVHTYNVVDIDPYGEPWEPYSALLPRIARPTAVFLTHCYRQLSGISRAVCTAVGIPEDWVSEIPHDGPTVEFLGQMALGQTLHHCDILHSAKMVIDREGGANVVYYALGLKPKEAQ